MLNDPTLRFIKGNHYQETRETTSPEDLNLLEAAAGCTESKVLSMSKVKETPPRLWR